MPPLPKVRAPHGTSPKYRQSFPKMCSIKYFSEWSEILFPRYKLGPERTEENWENVSLVYSCLTPLKTLSQPWQMLSFSRRVNLYLRTPRAITSHLNEFVADIWIIERLHIHHGKDLWNEDGGSYFPGVLCVISFHIPWTTIPSRSSVHWWLRAAKLNNVSQKVRKNSSILSTMKLYLSCTWDRYMYHRTTVYLSRAGHLKQRDMCIYHGQDIGVTHIPGTRRSSWRARRGGRGRAPTWSGVRCARRTGRFARVRTKREPWRKWGPGLQATETSRWDQKKWGERNDNIGRFYLEIERNKL